MDPLQLTLEVRRLTAPNEEIVFSLTVPPSPTLIAFQGRYLTRVGASHRYVPLDEIAQRAVETSGPTWDSRPSASPGRQRLHLSLQALAELVALSRETLPYAGRPAALQRLTRENLGLVRVGRPTRAAMLLFEGRSQDKSSGTGVQIAQFTDGRFLQERLLHGPLLSQVGETLETLRVFLGLAYDIGDRALLEGRGDLSLLERVQRTGSWPYPLAALLEAVVNLLISRDYASADGTRIRVKDMRLSIWNPGRLMAGFRLDDMRQPGHPSCRRNPHLAGLVERWGTGTTRSSARLKTLVCHQHSARTPAAPG